MPLESRGTGEFQVALVAMSGQMVLENVIVIKDSVIQRQFLANPTFPDALNGPDVSSQIDFSHLSLFHTNLFNL